ncbi:MAG: hypothetical protein AB1422_19335 [bacterium]
MPLKLKNLNIEYKFQSISIILSPYHFYLLIPFLTLLIYSLNGYKDWLSEILSADYDSGVRPSTKVG